MVAMVVMVTGAAVAMMKIIMVLRRTRPRMKMTMTISKTSGSQITVPECWGKKVWVVPTQSFFCSSEYV